MSTPGRGRGYPGRHHLREPRPGTEPEEVEPPRTLTELSPRATAVTSTTSNINKEIQLDESNVEIAQLLTIDDTYLPLLTLLEQFSLGEDGIQFNRKLRHFETTVTNMCPDETRLQQAFATFRAAALQSSVTARKLAAVGASFTRQQRQQLLRAALLNVVMQGTFSKLDLLEKTNPIYLMNAANLMGDYFAEARLCNGNKVHILAGPLVKYMKALLASDDIRAHRSLATQLMQNGRELLSVLTQELDELSISIRLRLLTPPPVSTVWLLLSADLCLNKFLPLPNTLQQFYAAHLDLTSDEAYSEVTYGSWKKSSEKDDSSTEKVSLSLSQVSLNTSDDSKPKLRPILGAGAGLLRQEQALSASQDNFETWTTKNSLNKRYDLNSWRQAEEEKADDSEPIFNPTVLPPNFQVPNYPPPNQFNYDSFANYLQQGDGKYIQNQYNNQNYSQSGDSFYQGQNDVQNTTEWGNERSHNIEKGNGDRTQSASNEWGSERSLSQSTASNERTREDRSKSVSTERVNERLPNDKCQTEKEKPEKGVERQVSLENRPPIPERVNNEVQKNSIRRPIENWRKEKNDLKEDSNRNRQKNWTRQKSNDNLSEDDDKKERSLSRNSREIRPGNRITRRNSGDSEQDRKTPPKRHVSDVPRNHKYWDHDDRCDKDYNS